MTATTYVRHRSIHNKHQMNMTRSARPGIPEAEVIIHLDTFAYRYNNGERPTESFHRQTEIKPLSGRQGSSFAPITANLRSSKRYKPGDYMCH